MNVYWKVGVAVWDTAYSFDQLFTYTSFEIVKAGCRVAVPFGWNNSKRMGMVMEVSETSEPLDARLKSVAFIMDDEPLLNEEQLELVRWMKETSFCTYSEPYFLLECRFRFIRGRSLQRKCLKQILQNRKAVCLHF